MRADRLPVAFTLLPALAAMLGLAAYAPTAGAAPPPAPAPGETEPAPPLPAYPDLSSNFVWTSSLKTVQQVFSGKLIRRGRQIYLEEESSSSGPISYNEYHIHDFDKNMLYRVLRDEKIYFETPLTIDQRVDAIRKGWVPAEGNFLFGSVSVKLSSRDVPLRPDTIDGRPVELLLREITAEIPAIGSAPARTVKYYTFVWKDPAYALPVKISYGLNFSNVIVEYRDITLEPVEAELFAVPKDFVNLTPY
ncbi:MAG: hypothetical protein AB1515_07150 [Nitrospirota bacterium]